MGRRDTAMDAALSIDEEVQRLERSYGGLTTRDLLARLITDVYRGRIGMVSSFGAEAAVLLHLVAEVDPATPVVFVDTDKLFGETLRYRDRLVKRFGLSDVRTIVPDSERVKAIDPQGVLWHSDKDLCCRIRKVEPLAPAMAGFDAWISGRKRFQSATRAAIPLFEAEGHQIKVNPLAGWGPKDLQAYADRHDLPPHPLVAQGYPSIGCMPCTDRVVEGEDARAGRWRGADKTECGIHLGLIGGGVADGSGI